MSLKLDLLKIARRFPLLIQLSRQFRRSRRRLVEFFGSRYYSKTADPETADSEIDTKLEEYLPFRNGFFIEVGAHNGFYESNTYHLEKFKGWKGVLVEPVPELFKECIKERPNSKVYNCALVPHDYPNTTIELFFADGTTHVKGIQNDNPSYLKKIREVGEKYSIPHYTARVPVRTLDSILDELAIKQIDFFLLM